MPPQREWFEKDYYEILGVPKDASKKDISKAYRRLARKYHPDANPGDAEAEEQFKEVSAAYDVLGDDSKRKEYDEVRRMAASGIGGSVGGGPGFGGGGFGGGGVHFEDVGGGFGGVEDILGAFFGRGAGGRTAGARGGTRAARGADLQTDVHLDFEQAVRGATVSVAVDTDKACSRCRGNGAEPGTSPTVCGQCGGAGTVAVDQGPFSFSQPCPACNGAGRTVEHPCTRCQGRGVERGRQNVSARVPPGVRDGQRIRVKGRGAAGRGGGPRGDLFVRVHVPAHPVFGRKGRYDLTLDLPVTYTEAVLGAEVKVPTLDGPVTMKVPAGTPSGRVMRVKGHGAHKPDGSRGDLLVTVEVAVPKKVSKEERELLERLDQLQAENPRRHLDA